MRDGFSKAIINSLAQRAAYTCSNPSCAQVTIGPLESSLIGTVNTGIAAHITAASLGGPRYNNAITSLERASIENGIWLCSYCANLVDKDESKYTVSLLKSWKEQREMRASYSQSGYTSDNGYLSKIKIKNIAKIINEQHIYFGKNTIIVGANATGKTLICEFISSLYDKKHLERWRNKRDSTNQENSFFEIEFFADFINNITIALRDGTISYFINGLQSPLIYSPYIVQYINKPFVYELSSREGLIKQFSSYFGLTADEFINLIDVIGKTSKFFLDDIIIKNDSLYVKHSSESCLIHLLALSGTEKDKVSLEIALRIANFQSQFKPTILILDHALTSLGTDDLNQVFNIFRSKSVSFQTIFTLTTINKTCNLESFIVWKLVETKQKVSAMRY